MQTGSSLTALLDILLYLVKSSSVFRYGVHSYTPLQHLAHCFASPGTQHFNIFLRYLACTSFQHLALFFATPGTQHFCILRYLFTSSVPFSKLWRTPLCWPMLKAHLHRWLSPRIPWWLTWVLGRWIIRGRSVGPVLHFLPIWRNTDRIDRISSILYSARTKAVNREDKRSRR